MWRAVYKLIFSGPEWQSWGNMDFIKVFSIDKVLLQYVKDFLYTHFMYISL